MANGSAVAADDRSVKAAEGNGARGSGSSLSPELALVDPDLAAGLRANLPNADDTLSRIELLVRSNRIVAFRAAAAAPPRSPLKSPPPPRARSRWRENRRAAVYGGGAVAAALVAALLVGVRVDVHGSPAGADTASVGVPPVPHTSTTAAVPPSPRLRRRVAPAGVPRRFVWAPVEGASAYRVQFFRGSSLVFSAETRAPEITVPANWKLGSMRQTLRPGDYEWYVWPLHGGLRAASAVVRARLSIPRR